MKLAVPLLALGLFSCSTAAPRDLSYPHTPQDLILEKGEPFPFVKIDLTPAAAELVTAVFRDVLANRHLASTLGFYGPTPLRTIGLGSFGSQYILPDTYDPGIAGYDFVHLDPQYEHPNSAPALLGMDIRGLVISGDIATVELGISCASGKNVIGGCWVRYDATRRNGAWDVRMVEAKDP